MTVTETRRHVQRRSDRTLGEILACLDRHLTELDGLAEAVRSRPDDTGSTR